MGLIDCLSKVFWIRSSSQNKEASASETNQRILLVFVLIGSILGILAIFLYALRASQILEGLSVFGIGIIFAGASFLVGSLAGFLFGIPRALQHSAPVAQKPTGTDAGKGKADESSYVTNTNLEQISDWLTKILVGVGLTQLSTISAKVSQLAAVVAPAIGPGQGNTAFAGSIFVYNLIFGFLLCYLWTRLYLQPALEDDRVAVLSDMVRQSERDARALAIVDKQLDRGFDAKIVDQKQLVETIRDSSEQMKAQIFSKAQTVRAMNWKDVDTKPIMERTIPIFRALIEIDVEGLYHRNHAELGYALKDQCGPDYAEAEKELTKAIEMRGPWKAEGWVLYEFNRAICRIKLDPSIRSRSPSAADVKDKILADIKVAASSEQVKGILLKEPCVTEWVGLNGVDPNSL